MTTITTRSGKGSPLTNAEVDANFTNLNDDKVEASGDSMTGNLSFGDNNKVILGSGSDLELYHDGLNSYIKDNGTGRLYIQSASDFLIANTANTQNYLYAVESGAVNLYYSGSKKFETTSTGIDVTGTVTLDNTLNISGGSTTAFVQASGTLFQVGASTASDLVAYTNNVERMRIDSSGRLGLGTTSPISILETETTANLVGYFKSTTNRSYILVSDDDTNTYLGAEGGSTYLSNAGASLSSGQLVIDSSGNVKINDAYLEVDTETSAAAVVRIDYNSTDSIRRIHALETGGGNARPLQIQAQDVRFRDDTAERMRIDSSGRVGIGTQSPKDAIDLGNATGGRGIAWGGVSADNHYTTIWSEYGSASLILGAGLKGSTSSSAFLNPFTGTYGYAAIELDSFSDDGIKFYVGADAARTKDATITPSEVMRINTSGNAVIGSTTAKTRLQISGAGQANTPSLGSISSNVPLYLTNNDTAYGLVIGNSGATGDAWLQAQRTDGTATAYDIQLNPAGGNVGIGTTNAPYKLTVSNGGAEGLEIGTGYISGANLMQHYNRATASWVRANTYADDHRFYTSGSTSPQVTIDTSGNVGLKNTIPSSFNASGLPLVVGDGVGNEGITIYSSSTGYGSLHFADGTSGNESYRGYIWYGHSGESMAFGTSGAEQMRLRDTGLRIGGGGNATAKLQVDGGGSLGSSYFYYNNTSAHYIDVDLLAFRNSSASEAARFTSTGLLGIGTSLPASALHVVRNTNNYVARFENTDATSPYGVWIREPASASSGYPLLNITDNAGTDTYFRVDSGSGNVGVGRAPVGIGAFKVVEAYNNASTGGIFNAVNNTGEFRIVKQSTDGYLNMTDSGSTVFQSNGSERMRIDSSGNLLVGKTAIGSTTDGFEARASGYTALSDTSGAALNVNRNSTDGAIVTFTKDGTTVGNIGTLSGDVNIGSGDTGLDFSAGLDAIMPYNSSTNGLRNAAIDLGQPTARFKDLYLSGGAYLGGTASANHLDDYEEGTFTPTIGGGTTNPTVTYDASRYGQYVKVGKMVFVNIRMRTDAVSGGSGLMQIGGLPFTNVGGKYSAVQIAYSKDWLGESPAGGYVNPSSTFFYLTYRTTASGDLENYVEISDLATGGNSNDLIVSVAYESA